MREVFLPRISSNDQGTKGLLLTEGFQCCSIELPWRDNKSNMSCIKAGSYICQPWASGRFGDVYNVTDVEGRTYILTHRGNLAGDTLLHWKTHSNGCILLGDRFGQLKIGDVFQDAVLMSKPTVTKFVRHMRNDPFILTIINAYLKVI